MAAKGAGAKPAPVNISPPDAPSPVSTPEEVAAANPPPAPEAAAEAEGEGAPAPAKRGRRKAADVKAEAAPAAAPEQNDEAVGEVLVANESLTKLLDGAKNDPETKPIEYPATALGDAEKLRTILMAPDPGLECGCQILFIDCAPMKGFTSGESITLDEVMHAFERVAATSAKKPDYRMISYESKGYLSLAIKTMMKGLPKTVIVDSRGPGADIFLSVVTPYAKMIFRGFRG